MSCCVSVGIKSRSLSDPALAKAHQAGEAIQRIQHAEHARLGTISYEIRRLWELHYLTARSGCMSLRQLHERVLHLPVETSGSRMLAAADTPDLTLLIYVAGTQMVLNTMLTMQHFCHEIERVLGAEPQRSGTISARIKDAFALAEIPVSASSPGYSALQEIIERRDAVEHPRRDNVFSTDPTGWDNVPMGWFLSERALTSFERWRDWFADALEQWKQHPAMQPRAMTLQVTRGVRSARPAKKPPKR